MFYYFAKLIDKNSPERVNAFLAVIGGIALVVSLLILIIAITCFAKELNTSLATITAGVVTLATLSKVDRPQVESVEPKVDAKPE